MGNLLRFLLQTRGIYLSEICKQRCQIASVRGFFTGTRNHWLSFAKEEPVDEVNPYIQYPVVTNEQLKKLPTDRFKFDFAYSSFGYHSQLSLPMIHSLSDLTEPTQLNSLLPRRRPHGSPVDTLSIKAGDDAMLVSPSVLAIADGVSGWESQDMADSGIWSRSMLETLSRLMTEYKVNHAPHLLNKRDIDQVIDDSFLHTSHLMDLQELSGSSTLIMGMIVGDLLQCISIGDSKLFVMRDGKIIKTNPEQMISSLCPQQIGTQTLGTIPSKLAWVDTIKLQQDDIVIVCSDGITDNLYDWELGEYVNEFTKKLSLKHVAQKIMIKAKEVGFDDYAYTPYNEKVNSLPTELGGGGNSHGGKVDDMSIAIGRVVLNDKSSIK
jgi:serine/threonine protein phosphatase PrpC